MKTKIFRKIPFFLAIALCIAGCSETVPLNDSNGEELQVSNVSFTPCLQTKAGTELSDRVDVEFTGKGVKITHFNFEVTCDFSAVNVTHTFVNGFLNITQQGSPNQAKCVCYTDVSYTISGISQNDVNVIFINGVQVYCYNNQTGNALVGKWLASGYHPYRAGYRDTIIFTEDFYVQQYFDYIIAGQVIPAMYLPPFATYSVSGDNITFTIHYSYPYIEKMSETFKYVLNGNSLTIKGFSNPFSDSEEARSDVHFTKIGNIYTGCEVVNCTEEYASVSIKLEYPDGSPVLLDSSKVFWVSQNRYLEQVSSWNEMRGYYVIVDDGMRKALEHKQEIMRFTGYLNGDIICERDVLAGADCCHVRYFGAEPLAQVIYGKGDCDKNVIISKDEYENAPDYPVSILDMKIEGNCLKIKFAASGCDGNSWNVKLIDNGSLAYSDPPLRTLRLSLDNKESCTAWITKEISFSLKPLMEYLRHNGTNQLYLNISGKRILYEY